MRDSKAARANPQAASASNPPASDAFQELFLEHWSMIYGLLVRMLGDPQESEDVALETFYKLYRYPPQQGEDSNIRGWLYRVATRLGLRSIRSQTRRQRYELAAGKYALEEVPGQQPAEILESKEARRLALQALSQMQPRQAQLLSLRYAGMAYKEIAQIMELAPTSIGPLLLRAEREFAKTYRSLSREEE